MSLWWNTIKVSNIPGRFLSRIHHEYPRCLSYTGNNHRPTEITNTRVYIVTDGFSEPTKRVKRKTNWVSDWFSGTISAVMPCYNISIIRIYCAWGTTKLGKAAVVSERCRRTTQQNKTSVQSSNNDVKNFFLVENNIVGAAALRNVNALVVIYFLT